MDTDLNYVNQESPERSEIINDIIGRATMASPKVLARVMNSVLPTLESMDPDRLRYHLALLRNNYIPLLLNPKSPSNVGQGFEGWTPKELQELYSVMFGEEA